MPTPEGKLKDEVKEYLSSLPNCFFYMPVPTGYGVRGLQDFIICWEGLFFAIETKAKGGKETPWQARTREKVIAAGGKAIVAYKIEDVHAIFSRP